MIPGYPEQLYTELCSVLESIAQQQLPEDKELEESFGACLRHEQQLKDWVATFRFDTAEDEILFFKTIKPKFSSQILYYIKRYQAVLFRPEELWKRIPFYEYEMDKADRFLTDNAGFYQYYKTGQTAKDSLFFKRCIEDDAAPDDPCHVDTACDQLLADIQGMERFKSYLRMEIEQCRKG